jgi:hypothetical protein
VAVSLRNVADRGLARRDLYSFSAVEELTSRKASTDIPDILDRMAVQFDPAVDARRKAQGRMGSGERIPRPISREEAHSNAFNSEEPCRGAAAQPDYARPAN